jgi:hypothetical protein
MSIAEKPNPLKGKEYRISNEAVELLRCFMSGLDDIIITIAHEIAHQRQGTGTDMVRIDSDDIEKAANYVLDQIRQQGNLPAPVRTDVDQMETCLKAKCREMKDNMK